MADSNLPQGHDDGTTDFDQPYAAWRYQEDLPEDALDEGPLVEGLKLFQEYSGIPRDQVKEHVKAVVSPKNIHPTVPYLTSHKMDSA